MVSWSSPVQMESQHLLMFLHQPSFLWQLAMACPFSLVALEVVASFPRPSWISTLGVEAWFPWHPMLQQWFYLPWFLLQLLDRSACRHLQASWWQCHSTPCNLGPLSRQQRLLGPMKRVRGSALEYWLWQQCSATKWTLQWASWVVFFLIEPSAQEGSSTRTRHQHRNSKTCFHCNQMQSGFYVSSVLKLGLVSMLLNILNIINCRIDILFL